MNSNVQGLPPNTFDLTMKFRVTLPQGETPDRQDPCLLITGEDYNPWPGVVIHDAEMLAHAPAGTVSAITPTSIVQMALQGFTAAAIDVMNERHRQVNAEGWTPEHDDQHSDGDLAVAAACYAAYDDLPFHTVPHVGNTGDRGDAWQEVPDLWPWNPDWWKPTEYRRDLVKAGALILAEIERLDRQAAKEGGE